MNIVKIIYIYSALSVEMENVYKMHGIYIKK